MSNVVIFGLLGFVIVSAAIVPLSLLVEEMRPVPPTPERLSCAPDIPIRYVSVNGVRLRYIKTGEGPALVLLHTLRTQLDLFEKVVPELAKSFTVYAVDYPGHGYSDIPPTHHEISAQRRRRRPAAHSAGAAEGNVSRRQPQGPLSRLPQSTPQCRKLGNGDQGLFEH